MSKIKDLYKNDRPREKLIQEEAQFEQQKSYLFIKRK